MRVALLNIITNPRVLASLRAEMDDAVAEGKVSSPIQYEEAKRLPYLQASILAFKI